ncbi:hypothetical protein NH341_00145 [Tenacibaculum sp. XPcli2-G]|uniref:hypothetical protein n=1 Tax=Tenacibaculum sp. XPcli2-G TaxID=2954503 RepID=UPI002096E585|nr:hypothetical protein [Tenacibaculum sp. XPcli2-G]MCO7183822.1 hypothetical protein [Tenacibaculum sp. XPcli2-G]
MARGEIIKVKRKVNYYELELTFSEDSDFESFFETLTRLAKTRAKIRYQRFGNKYVFIQGIENKNNLIKAKMRCVRKDLLPELMNTETDETKGIDAKEEEGLVETTHFILDYRKNGKVFLALEYNHYGSKITDLVNYIERVGIDQNVLERVGFKPIVKDELETFKDRVNRFSEFIVKVHKDNIAKIKEVDQKIWSAVNYSIEHFSSEYATLTLKFDYKQAPEESAIKQSVFNIIRNFSKSPKNKNLFNKLSLKAEDGEKDNLLENFDLLLEKVNSEIRVERKKKYRTIISNDMFQQMLKELNDKKLQ